MKQELEAEYLATFKKTVAMHETFLTRLATHPVFRYPMAFGLCFRLNNSGSILTNGF
jgi:hypothetical protein